MISAEAAKMLLLLILYLPVHRKDGPHTKRNQGPGSLPEPYLSSRMWPSQAHCRMKEPEIFAAGSLPFHLGVIGWR